MVAETIRLSKSERRFLRMKKLVSILLTFALLLSVSVTAFAEEATPTNQQDAKYSISVGDSDIV